MKNKCNLCCGLKDVRAKQCKKCKFFYSPPRRGTGIGKRKSTNGYIVFMKNNKEVYVHRAIMEAFLKRPLLRKEHVHHIDHIKTNNRIENLELLDESEHHRKHFTKERAKELSILAHKVQKKIRDAHI